MYSTFVKLLKVWCQGIQGFIRHGKPFFLWTLNFWEYRYGGGKTRIWRQIFNRDKSALIKYVTQIHFFLPFDLFTWYLHILHHIHAFKRTFVKLFHTCMSKDSKVAEKWTNLVEKWRKNVLCGVYGVCFSKSGYYISAQLFFAQS